MLLGVSSVFALGMRSLTVAFAPAPPVLESWLACLGCLLLFIVVVAIDAVRRVRRPPAPASRTWLQSTWLAGGIVLAVQIGLAYALPLGWRSFSIPSQSMVPSLRVGDVFVSDKRPDRPTPARGTVVVFPLVQRPGSLYVKRVIGLPGDRVQIAAGQVILNGQPIRQRPDGSMTVPDESSGTTQGRVFIETMPNGPSYRIMRIDDGSSQSDMATTVVPPGEAFVLGDNRDNSLDSRFADQFGNARLGDLVATAGGGTIFWSRDAARLFMPVR